MIDLDLNPDTRKIRQFGWASLIAFAAFGIAAYTRYDNAFLAWVCWAGALLAPVLGYAFPSLLKPLYIALALLTFPIGFIVSHIALALIFYGMFAPIGLIFRLTGRDSMNRKISPKATSYWLDKCPPRPAKDYYRQF